MTSVVVVRLEDTNASVMEYLDSMGILPDTEIYVLEKGPLNATILISLDGVEHSLSESLARQIFVKIEWTFSSLIIGLLVLWGQFRERRVFMAGKRSWT